MTTRRGRPMDYVGKYPCVSCGKNVMVYDWLGSAVLCGRCEKKIERQEAKSEGPHE